MALSDAKMVRPTLGLHLDFPRHIFYLSLLFFFYRSLEVDFFIRPYLLTDLNIPQKQMYFLRFFKKYASITH